jgi:hypothetical protein
MIQNLSATDIARAIIQNFGDWLQGVRTTFPRFQINFGPI